MKITDLKNRRGIILISNEAWEHLINYGKISILYNEFFPIDIKYLELHVQLRCISNKFDSLTEGESTPRYEIWFTLNEKDVLYISRVERKDDWQCPYCASTIKVDKPQSINTAKRCETCAYLHRVTPQEPCNSCIDNDKYESAIHDYCMGCTFIPKVDAMPLLYCNDCNGGNKFKRKIK